MAEITLPTKQQVADVKNDTEAILAAGGGKVMRSKVYEANGTFVVPAGVTEVYLTGCGGGGGGGGAIGTGAGGGGGGASFVSDYPVSVIPNNTVNITIGNRGLKGIGRSGNYPDNTIQKGTSGGITSFGNLLSLQGGGGADSSGGAGAHPGTGVGGFSGGRNSSEGVTGASAIGGSGGNSGNFVGGVGGEETSRGGTGINGGSASIGAGGGGGSTGASGGLGGDGGNGGVGILIVKWWE